MSIEQMRVYIADHPKYKNSPNWRYRCQTMPSSQVVAIYNNFRKMDYKKIEKELKAQDKDNQSYHQINIFEYMEGLVNE